MTLLIRLRDTLIGRAYRHLVKPILFKFDPEAVHDFFTALGAFLGRYRVTRFLTHAGFNHPSRPIIAQTIAGITFPNPVGLAAGFDKDARLTDILSAVGFGFAEVGSVTGRPCEGNPKPRLWRLPTSRSLIVYYGLKNDGAEKIAERLNGKRFRIPIGVSVAKTNDSATTTVAEGIADYLQAYDAFTSRDLGDYFTINISCPNAYGGQPFTEPDNLELLLEALAKREPSKPIFLKMPPDLPREQVDDIIDLARRFEMITGFICTNLTKDKINGEVRDKIREPLPSDLGGLSGKVVEDLSNDLIKYIYKKTGGQFIVIGCGGVFTAEDAYKKIKLGASLIQLVTGMIFEGPQTISAINLGLVRLLTRDGYANISEAIGVESL